MVNKLGKVENKYRAFAIELLAGKGDNDGDYDAEVKGEGTRFLLILGTFIGSYCMLSELSQNLPPHIYVGVFSDFILLR